MKFFSKSNTDKLHRLPSGSFTVDATGRVVTSTVPQWFPAAQSSEIAKQVLAAFHSAQKAQLQVSELIIYYAALKITARGLRGGAIIFLAPKTLQSNLNR